MGVRGGAVKRFAWIRPDVAPNDGAASMTTAAKRGYDSPFRDEQARATRRAIVAAAAELFVAQGYAATTMDAIAKRANVSRKTVFAAGSKFALLKDAFDWSLVGDDEPIPMADRAPVQNILATDDPAQAVRLWAAMITETATRAAPIGAALAAAAHVDEEAAAFIRLSDQHRLGGARAFVAHLVAIGGLRPGLTAADAADLCWLAMDPGPYVRLVIERGWPPARFQDWLTAAVGRELLGLPPLTPPSPDPGLRQVDGGSDVPETPGNEQFTAP
jgi:AcrR family transcriptional regulator